MTVWTCELRPGTVSRLKEYLPEGQIPRQVRFQAPDQASMEEVRKQAANALLAKLSALGGNYEQDIFMALTDAESMRCTPGEGERDV